MAEIVKGFLQGTMNKDADERLLPEGQYRDALNIEVYNQEGSSTGSVHNKLGNTKIADLSVCSGQNTTTAKTIGAVSYEANNLIYWFVAADTFDGIYEFNTDTNTIVRVLQSNKLTPDTASKLNFRKEYPITGVNYIPGRNGNNYLYWTDDYNAPRRVNITRVKSYQIDDNRIDIDIDVIIRPPLYAPAIHPYLDTTDPNSNNMKEKFIEFAYRWKNIDGQYSATSPYSAVSFKPTSYSYDYGIGNNKSMTNIFNAVKIAVETGDEFVDEIQIILKDTRSPNANIVETVSKSKLGLQNNSTYNFDFKNNKTYSVLPIDQTTRLFDNVPLLAKSQDVIGNRLSYGNYTQFRDIKKCNGDEILVDYNLGVISSGTASLTSPKSTFRSNRDYEVGIIYGDEYGRMTTPSTSSNSSIYIPPILSTKANSIKMSIDSKPPCWATNYRIVVKQSKGEYYNLFPITFYTDGLFRYFLIHQSDSDKIKVGDYVIFKLDTDGATNSNKKYKILEIDNKDENFISGGTVNEIEGIYFKIKVDSPSELADTSIMEYSSSNKGWTFNFATTTYVDFCTEKYGPKPFINGFLSVENPIYYGDGDPNRITLQTNNTNYNKYSRIVIEGNSSGTLSYYRIDGPKSSPIYIQQNITPSSSLDIYTGFNGVFDSTTFLFTVNIQPGSVFTELDRWAIVVRDTDWGASASNSKIVFPGDNFPSTPIFPGAVIRIKLEEEGNPSIQPNIAFPPSPARYENIEEWWYETSAIDYFKYYAYDGTLNTTEMRFVRGSFLSSQHPDFPGEYGNQVDAGGSQSQYTLSLPIRLIVTGSVNISDVSGILNNPCKQFYFKVDFALRQQSTQTVCETDPVDTDLDIYHEVFQTHDIVDGLHTVLWDYDDFQFKNGNTLLTQLTNRKPHYFSVGSEVTITSSNINGPYVVTEVPNQHSIVIDLPFPGSGPAIGGTVKFTGSLEKDQTNFTPAIIEINKPQAINSEYNAWCYGNGVESNRILDDYNETTKQYSIRAYTPFEGYRQVRNEASICYSGVYSENSSLNRLNEFNLSTANFKHLEKEFGSVQKLNARDTDLLVFQENKVSKVLYGKNVLYDSTGGGQVTSIPEVLGTQIAFYGEYGISKNPESFSKWGPDSFFTDQRNGLVLQLTGDQIVEISSAGMVDFFRDLMEANPTTEKIGAFDPHNRMYILASTEQEVIPCTLDISRTSLTVPKDPSGFMAFTVTTDSEWTISLVNTGSGTSWVTDFTAIGFGSQTIYAQVAQNNTTSNRTVKFVVSYCDGLTKEFTLTQARGRKGKVIIGVLNGNPDNIIKIP